MSDISDAFTPQKIEFMRAGGSYAIVLEKITIFAAQTLDIEMPTVFATSTEVSVPNQGLTAVEKIFNKNIVGNKSGKILHAGSDVRVK